jgi:thymidylate synthase
MRNYLELLHRVMTHGKRHENRTGVATRRILGAQLDYYMDEGFPAVTTKKLAFGAVKGELLGFIRGCTSAADFRDLGCQIWNQNANENNAWMTNPHRKGVDDLGRIYGAQWRSWAIGELHCYDQLANAVHMIKHDPESRRIIVNAWQPAELDQMALPPCHVLHQYHVDVEAGTLSMTMYQRSCDLFLGVPFNIASYALLLHLVAKATGLKADQLSMFLADVHIYENHFEQVKEQLRRPLIQLPSLHISERLPLGALSPIEWLDSLVPADITLDDYCPHAAIPAPMAV